MFDAAVPVRATIVGWREWFLVVARFLLRRGGYFRSGPHRGSQCLLHLGRYARPAWLAAVTWHNGWRLRGPPANPFPYFHEHVTPILWLSNAVSYVVPLMVPLRGALGEVRLLRGVYRGDPCALCRRNLSRLAVQRTTAERASDGHRVAGGTDGGVQRRRRHRAGLAASGAGQFRRSRYGFSSRWLDATTAWRRAGSSRAWRCAKTPACMCSFRFCCGSVCWRSGGGASIGT